MSADPSSTTTTPGSSANPPGANSASVVPPPVAPAVPPPVVTPPTDNGTATAPDLTAPPADKQPPGTDGEAEATIEVNAERLSGAGVNYGTIYNLLDRERERSAPRSVRWEDEVHTAERLAEPEQLPPAEEVERCAQELSARRVLLIRHVLHREAEAVATTRAVVSLLRQREPGRTAFCSKSDRVLRPQELCDAAEWRADRRNSLIYLFCVDDAASLEFFNRHVERVQALCERLRQMDGYLVLTLAVPAASTLREEAQLGRLISLYRLDDAQHKVFRELRDTLSSRFEATLAICAALFPGLGIGEFLRLADALCPPLPPRAATAKDAADSAAPPPTRHERWVQGERDAVLAELQIRLRPLAASDGDTPSRAKGMTVDDPSWRIEMPGWLYERYPILLTEVLDTLTRHYLAPEASPQFRRCYRNTVLELEARGIQPLSADWLNRQLLDGLRGAAPLLTAERFADLLADVPDEGDGRQLLSDLVGCVERFVAEQESNLASAVFARAAVGEDALPSLYGQKFWPWAKNDGAIGQVVIDTALRQAAALDLLLLLAPRCAPGVVQALGTALHRSNKVYERWLDLDPDETPEQPVLSLARVILRERQTDLLAQMPLRWLELAESLLQMFEKQRTDSPSTPRWPDPEAPADRLHAAQAWLRWDFAYALAASLGELPESRWPARLYDTLLAAVDARRRLAKVLAGLLCAPSAADADAEFSISGHTLLWVYRSLLLAVLLGGGGADEHESMAGDLLLPLRTALRLTQQRTLLALARKRLQRDMDARSQVDPRQPRELAVATRQLRASQLLVRQLSKAAPETAAPPQAQV